MTLCALLLDAYVPTSTDNLPVLLGKKNMKPFLSLTLAFSITMGIVLGFLLHFLPCTSIINPFIEGHVAIDFYCFGFKYITLN